ncbi:MAG: DUF2061 domain-containing protein [Salibacteraceae bacterium]
MIIDQLIDNRTKVKVRQRLRKSSNGPDTPIRSLVKAFTWRAVGTLDTIAISWVLTNEFTIAFSIGSVELVTKMVLYYIHERAWVQVRWGKRTKNDHV